MKNKKVIYIVGSIVLLILIGVVACKTLILNTPLKIEKAAYLYIDSDDNIDSVYTKLKKDFHTSDITGLRMLISCSNYAENIHEGAYKLKPTDNTWHIFHQLKSGHQTPIRLTVPSVRTLGALAKSVSRRLMTDSASIASLLNDSTYCSTLGYNQYTIPALFIPNTYEVYWTMSPEDFIKRMKKEHDRFWNKERMEKAKSIGFTPEEVTTLASIVEEETANKAEKPMVAGLYINRLHTGMPLQADPTVKFGLQEFGLKRILHKHLETDSPYNTYKHAGLPPGPIRIPSIDGLESVLNYAKHDYLYMCAKEDFSGTHNFAKSWNEHLANARRYQRALNQRNIH